MTMTMVITALLLHVVATERWKWPLPSRCVVTGIFLSIDLAFLGANVLKIMQGGWLPLVIGAAIFHADDHVEDRAAAFWPSASPSGPFRSRSSWSASARTRPCASRARRSS